MSTEKSVANNCKLFNLIPSLPPCHLNQVRATPFLFLKTHLLKPSQRHKIACANLTGSKEHGAKPFETHARRHSSLKNPFPSRISDAQRNARRRTICEKQLERDSNKKRQALNAFASQISSPNSKKSTTISGKLRNPLRVWLCVIIVYDTLDSERERERNSESERNRSWNY